MRSTAVFAKICWFRMVYKPHFCGIIKAETSLKPIAEMPQKGQRMKKQLLHTYRFVFLCMLIAVVGLCLVAGYSVRVLDQNQVIQQVDTNMEAAKCG